MVLAMSIVVNDDVEGLSTPMLSALRGTKYMRPLGPSTPPTCFQSGEKVFAMSIAVNVLDPAAYPGTGVRLRVAYVPG
jgi:hypothetical protein